MAIYNFNGMIIDSTTIKKEDMPNTAFEEIYDFCGAECAVSLLYHMRGSLIPIPNNGMKKLEKRIIQENYDGTTASIRAISRKYGISESKIREIARENKISVASPGQESLPLKFV